MERGKGIAALFREECEKNPTVQTLGALAKTVVCKPFDTVSVLIQVLLKFVLDQIIN